MSKGIALGIILVLVLSIAGCSSTPSKIKATWITPTVAGDTISIPVSQVEKDKIVHFKVNTSNGTIAFMAYGLGDKVYVRSNICPPCRSVGFSLQGDTLVCDTSATTFKASSGAGSQGACVA